MDNYLINVKVGDYIWTIKYGWTEVISIDLKDAYPIKVNYASYTISGRHMKNDMNPSAFLEPPEGFDAEPKPVTKKTVYKWAYQREGLDRVMDTRYYYDTEDDFKKHTAKTGAPLKFYVRLDNTALEVEE